MKHFPLYYREICQHLLASVYFCSNVIIEIMLTIIQINCQLVTVFVSSVRSSSGSRISIMIIISSYHHIIISSYHHIIISSYHHVVLSFVLEKKLHKKWRSRIVFLCHSIYAMIVWARPALSLNGILWYFTKLVLHGIVREGAVLIR